MPKSKPYTITPGAVPTVRLYRAITGPVVPNWLLPNKDLSAESKLCYGTLIKLMGRKHYCIVSVEGLAEILGTSAEKTRRGLKQLKRLGYICTISKAWFDESDVRPCKFRLVLRKEMSRDSKFNKRLSLEEFLVLMDLIDIGALEDIVSPVVYFLQAGPTGLVKIGTSTNISTRVKELQKCSAEKLIILGFLRGSYELESKWHLRFQSLRVQGEWFKPDQKLLGTIKEESVPLWGLVVEDREKAFDAQWDEAHGGSDTQPTCPF